jgi:hypothetical protein
VSARGALDRALARLGVNVGDSESENPAETSSGGGAGDGAVSFEEVRKEAKKNRVRASGLKANADRAASSAAAEISDADLDQLFQGEQWEEVAALYPQARFAMTGDDVFQLTDAQRRMLGATMASTMRMLLKIDPRYVALAVFTINYGAIITGMEARHYARVSAEKARVVAARRAAPATDG